MKNSPLTEFARSIARDPNRFETHPEYIGYLKRYDGWSKPDWKRDGDWSVLYFVGAGEIRISSSNRRITAVPGDGLFIGHKTRPTIQFSTPIELHEVWCRFTQLPDSMRITTGFEKILKFRTPQEAVSIVDHLAADRALAEDPGIRETSSLRASLLFALCNHEIELYTEESRRLTSYQRIHLVRWVRENMANRPTPTQAADELGFSPDYFGRIFRNTFGMAPRDWIILQRIQSARRLLDEETASSSEIMQQCGFKDRSHFARQMKRLTGKTPGGGRGWKQRKPENTHEKRKG